MRTRAEKELKGHRQPCLCLSRCGREVFAKEEKYKFPCLLSSLLVVDFGSVLVHEGMTATIVSVELEHDTELLALALQHIRSLSGERFQ